MRILISVLAILVVGLLATQAADSADYCKRSDGSVYISPPHLCGFHYFDKKITKTEYDRLKIKGGLKYCRRPNNSVYRVITESGV